MVLAGFAEGAIPGVGAIDGELGAGVLIGIPGIGPMVGCAARTGVTDATLIATARITGRTNNGNLVRASAYYAP
jgi:hypothetical protein